MTLQRGEKGVKVIRYTHVGVQNHESTIMDEQNFVEYVQVRGSSGRACFSLMLIDPPTRQCRVVIGD